MTRQTGIWLNDKEEEFIKKHLISISKVWHEAMKKLMADYYKEKEENKS